MFRLEPDLHKGLKTAVRKKKARSANAYVEAAVREKLIADGIIKPKQSAAQARKDGIT